MIHRVEAEVKRSFKSWKNFEAKFFSSNRGQKQKINNHINKLNKLLEPLNLEVVISEKNFDIF